VERRLKIHHRRRGCAGALDQTVGVVEIEAERFFEKVAACVRTANAISCAGVARTATASISVSRSRASGSR
jgi:hypothetical protein